MYYFFRDIGLSGCLKRRSAGKMPLFDVQNQVAQYLTLKSELLVWHGACIFALFDTKDVAVALKLRDLKSENGLLQYESD